MPHEKTLPELLPELGVNISTYLPIYTIASLLCVSKSCHALFSNDAIWKTKLITDFGFTEDELPSSTRSYKEVYKKLFELFQKIKHINSLSYGSALTNKKILFAYGTSNVIDEIDINKIFSLASITNDEQLLNEAAQYGASKIVQHLICQYQIKPTNQTLNCAIIGITKSRDLDLLNYLLDPNNEFKLTPNSNSYQQLSVIPPYSPAAKLRKEILNLFKSCASINRALSTLKEHAKINHILKDLQSSHQDSPFHFQRVMEHVFSNPEKYELNDNILRDLATLDIISQIPFTNSTVLTSFRRSCAL